MHSRQRWCDGGAVEPCSNLSLLQTIMMWWYDVTVIWGYEDMKTWRCRDRDTGGWGPRSGRPSATPPCCSSSWVGTWSTVLTSKIQRKFVVTFNSILRLISDIHETFRLDPEPWTCLLSNLVSPYKTCNRKRRSFLELQQPLKFSFLLLNGQPFTERNEAIFVEIDEIIKRIFLNLKLFLTCAETGIAVQM